jgi:hypothetical protein
MSKPALAPPVYRHRSERWETTGDITVADDCGRELVARLGNISDGGFMAECEERLPLGTIIVANLPNQGEVRAEIRWVFGWRFGAMILAD